MDLAGARGAAHHAVHAGRRLFLAMALCCAGVVAVTPLPARAEVPTLDLVCFLSFQINFSPPLNFRATSARTIALISTCLSPNGRYSRLRSAIVFGTTGSNATGCSPVPLTVTGKDVAVFWSDGSQSIFSYTLNTDLTANGPIRIMGHFDSGTLAGANLADVPLLLAQNGLCGLGGVRSLSAAGLTIITQ